MSSKSCRRPCRPAIDYDGWISDSDLIGTHYRLRRHLAALRLHCRSGQALYESQPLDVKDFIGTKFTTAHGRQLYQLPRSAVRKLYWFRRRLVPAPKICRTNSKAEVTGILGSAGEWSAYEDIANFFSNDVKGARRKKVYGHMDYGKKDPSLGWPLTDAWLSMAGSAIRMPKWIAGRRMGNQSRRRSLHARRRIGRARRATNSPAAVYGADESTSSG